MWDKRNWKVVYSDYSGMEKKAVELVSKELGAQILRDKGVYTIHVLACEPESKSVLDKNAVVIGTYEESTVIRTYISENEILKDGYVVKVMDNPENPEYKLVLITAKNKRDVFYGAVDFVDDYFVKATPSCGCVKLPDEIFLNKLPDYYNASAPKVKTRSIFTWGNPINDYRAYIDNMARLRLNQLIIWNDYAPINAKDVVEYAHEYEISIIWAYAWGWNQNCDQTDLDTLDALSENVIQKFEDEYADIGGDGIYFQSFTETHKDMIGDRLIAEAVVDFVNKTADKLLKKYPDLFIQFGLHSTSVCNHLSFISKVDERVEILWEDCGTFPYDSTGLERIDENKFEATLEFTNRIMNLRDKGGVGVLYKGQMILDWSKFAHQSGPFVLGNSSESIIRHDLDVVTPIWRNFQSYWFANGRYAYDMTRCIIESGKEQVNIGMAGMFAGGLWFTEALCAQILWECDKPYEDIVEKVSVRRCLDRV